MTNEHFNKIQAEIVAALEKLKNAKTADERRNLLATVRLLLLDIDRLTQEPGERR